jgi:hypothetical protein
MPLKVPEPTGYCGNGVSNRSRATGDPLSEELLDSKPFERVGRGCGQLTNQRVITRRLCGQVLQRKVIQLNLADGQGFGVAADVSDFEAHLAW